jgi:sugar lactone lactonase YvrE
MPRHTAACTRWPRLLSLGFVLFLPSTSYAPHASGGAAVALAPVEVWTGGFLQPRGVAVDGGGFVYVSDRAAGTVTRIAPDHSTTVVARGLERPIGLAFDLEGRLLVAEERAGRVVRLDAAGARTALVSGVKQPRWLDVGEDGTLFITARRLTRDIDPEPDDESAEPEVIVARALSGALTLFVDGFLGLRGIVASRGAVYAATDGRRDEPRADGVVYRIPILADGRAGTPVPIPPVAGLRKPTALAQDRLGALFVTTRELTVPGHRARRAIAKLQSDGSVGLFADGLDHPQGLAFDAAGNLYVADGRGRGRVLRFHAPAAPDLDPLPALTRERSVAVTGVADPDSRIDVHTGADEGSFTGHGDATGRFRVLPHLASNAVNPVEVLATAHRGQGLSSAPATALIRHDDVAPDTMITSGPASPSTETTATFTFGGVDDVTPPDALRFAWRLDNQPFSAFSAQAAATIADLTDGAHTMEVVAQDEAGNVDPTPATRTFAVSRFQVTLDEPAAGDTVPAGLRLVRGTVSAESGEIGVTVNGVAAAVHGSVFAALVPLTIATVHLQIVATTASGGATTREVPITVVTAPDSPVLFLATPRSGVAPVAVSFALIGTASPSAVEVDFDGDGTVDFTGQRLDGHVFTYARPGLYVPRATVVDAQGQRTIVPTVVQTFDRAALEALLQAKWSAMKAALRRGDVPQALSHVATRARTRYQETFTVLAPDLPLIDSILTDLAFVRVRGQEAIFEMRRTDAGVAKSFEVRFQIDTDGLWRLRIF